MKKLSLLMLLILTACGSGPSPAPTDPRVTTFRNNFMSSCNAQATPKVGSAKAQIYCDCMLDAMLNMFTIDQIEAMGEASASAKLLSSDAPKTCNTKAGI